MLNKQAAISEISTIIIGIFFFLAIFKAWVSQAPSWQSNHPDSGGTEVPAKEASSKNSDSNNNLFTPKRLKGILHPPQDYQVLSHDEEICEHMYGSTYLSYAATHQISHCESGSIAGLQCFSARRQPFPHSWPVDTFCIAQGALVTRSATEDRETNLSLQCLLQEPATKGHGAPAKVDSLIDVDSIRSVKEYFFGTGATCQLQDWDISPSSVAGTACSGESGHNNDRWIMLVRREGNHNIFHNLMEIWQAMLTFDAVSMAVNPKTGKAYLSDKDVDNARIVFEDDRDQPYDEWWAVVMQNGHAPLRKSSLAPGCYANVILPMAGSSSPFWSATAEAEYHPACRNEYLVNALRKRMFDHYGITPRGRDDVNIHPNITIVDRKKSRALWEMDGMVQSAKERYPESTINVVDFAQITLKEQIQLAIDTDVLVGAHGAGLVHSIWMQPDAAVVEIKPPLFPGQGFRYYAMIHGANYFAGRATWSEIWNQSVNGVDLPQGWAPPKHNPGWTETPYLYVEPKEFIGVMDAAVRSQENKVYQKGLILTCEDHDCHFELKED